MAADVFFTIIIPTRNRPELFKLALDSVLAQTFSSKEVVVVNDGSDQEYLEAYKKLEQAYVGQPVKWRYQIKRPNGHGQSYSMNTGALVGNGKYIGFLDDDDYWTDEQHLQRAHDSITSHKQQVDAYYSNQTAFFSDGSPQKDNVWIEDLAKKLNKREQDDFGSYEVSVPFLLTSGGFAHLNCSIIRRQLYLDIKGMDEGIRYECDRDIFIRTIDVSGCILYNPKVISKHHIPDKKKKENMSTLISAFEKYIFQITVYEKAVLLSKQKAIREHSAQGLAYIYKHITTIYQQQSDYRSAAQYARKAQALQPSLKWWLNTVYLRLRAL